MCHKADEAIDKLCISGIDSIIGACKNCKLPDLTGMFNAFMA